MSEIKDSGDVVLEPQIQALVGLDGECVENFRTVIDDYSNNPIDNPNAHPAEQTLVVGHYTSALEGCAEMYLRSAESMCHFDLKEGVDVISVFNAMESTRSTLKRVMVGVDFEGDPSLSELFIMFRHVYLPSLDRRTKNVFYGKSIHKPTTEKHVDQAVAVANYMGRAVVLPVIEASSELFVEVLSAVPHSRKHLGYYESNLRSSVLKRTY